MPFSEAYRPHPPLRETLQRGALIGLSGGLAEALFIWAYMSAGDHHPAAIAVAFAAAFHLGSDPATGIVLHMTLSLLGIGLAVIWPSVREPRPKPASAYLFMTAALIVVWSFNFLVLFPSLSVALVVLLPYPVSFVATLLFALTGAPVLQHLGDARHLGMLRHPSLQAPAPERRIEV